MARRQLTKRPLPDRISLWISEHRLMVVGALLVAAATVFATWVTLASLPLADQREVVVHWLGGGAYLLAAVVALFGALTGIQRVRSSVRKDRHLTRQGTGVGLAALALWGIAGAITPNASLGGVSLARYGAGGQVGGWLDSPVGWGLILIGLVGAFALIAPSAAQALANKAGQALESLMRTIGREIKAKGPGAIASMGRAAWVGFVALVFAIWRSVQWTGRELWLAFGVIGQQWRESRSDEQPAARQNPAPMPTTQSRAPAPDEPAWAPLTESPPAEAEEPVAETQWQRQPPVEAPPVVATPPSTLRTLDRTATDGWRLPPIELLDEDPTTTLRSGAEDQAQTIVDTLASFGVDAAVTQINEGPAITQFGVEPGWEVKTRQVPVKDASGAPVLDDQGQPLMRAEEVSRTRVRVNRITRLADDLALALAAPSIRIEAPVPGQPIVGVEVPNADTRIVALRGLIESEDFNRMAAAGGLPIALGRDVTGNPVIADLTRMPHVLIAGATGSGKSVCINTIISSLLMQKSPEEVRLILVDPKRVELTGYGSAPHLAFSHVVTEPDEVVSVLGVVVAEMDRRYRKLEEHRARNLVAYNSLPTTEKRLPYWVVVLDELADMMMAAAAEVEGQIVRLAQLARAVGIHLVIATQRPSVDVVTGLIKANFPTRIAFATTSQTDARVIMDRAGAEKLMGRGDMLYMSSDSIKPRRVQGAYVSDAEIERLLESWTAPNQAETERTSLDEVLEELAEESPSAANEVEARAAQADLRHLTSTLETALDADTPDEAPEEPPDIVVESAPIAATELDTRLGEATELAREYERVSATLLQRRMRVGRPRAERLIEQLAEAGVIEDSDGGRSRRVLRPSK
jgi:S-DNA-T family DNA segregation ATPase FtsK/SpoIIIE